MTLCEPCICGGVIYADSLEFASVAVQLHNASVTHQIWRAIREGRLLAEETTTVAHRDKLNGDGIPRSSQATSDPQRVGALLSSSFGRSSSEPAETAEGPARAESERLH